MEQLTDKPLLEFANVTFGYGNNQDKVLQNVSFSIFPGDQLGILGDNGSGKSTIIKILLGLYSPEQGKVSLFDQKVSWKKHYPKLGYIGDPSYNLGELGLPTSLSVKNVVEIFKLLWKQSNQYLPSCDDIEQRLNIPNFYSCNIGKLSKGQRMRLMAFLALGKKIDLLVADEATEGLDGKVKKIILSEIKRAIEDFNLSILWISHKFDEIFVLTNKIYELQDGYLNQKITDNFNYKIEIKSSSLGSNVDQSIDQHNIFQVIGELLENSLIDEFTIKVRK